jgi:FAD/FMN-containing dehydrogenase
VENDDQSTDNYYKLLNFSIQNLRFAESTVPKPIATVLPESVDQLVDAVLCSREESTEFRVRCGGHSYEGTLSVAVDGAPFVIIDMMNLNRISVEVVLNYLMKY